MKWSTGGRRLSARRAVVGPGDDLGVAGVLVGAACLGRRLGGTGALLEALGGPVTAMALSFGASSLGLLEAEGAKAVGAIRDAAVQVATPALLLDADAGELRQNGGPLLNVFGLAALASTVAAIVAFALTKRRMAAALGSDAAKVCAALAAKNIGGGVNFAAVCAATRASPVAAASALCADNVMALVYFPACNAVAGTEPPVVPAGVSSLAEDPEADPAVNVGGLLDASFAALLILIISDRLAPPGARLPAATVGALLSAAILGYFEKTKKVKLFNRKAGSVLADSLLYLFFAGAGAAGGSLTVAFRDAGPVLMAFLLVLYLGHVSLLAAFYFALGGRQENPRQARYRRAQYAVASNAAIGGPATAAALCQSKGWTLASTPAVCVGTVGYAIASFIGLLLYRGFSAPWCPF